MPGVESDSDAAACDQMVVEALECFCCSSVQSYEQFLGSFAHLSPGSAGSRHATVPPQVNRLPREMERSGESRQRRWSRATDVAEEEDPGMRRQADRCVLPADQEEIVLSDGMTVGGNEGCFPPGATLKVDNYLDVGDFSQQEEDNGTTDPAGVGVVLPGEAEEDVLAYLPSFRRFTRLELTSTARGTGTGTRGQQETREGPSESEEVMPFSLDEDFDYDHVVLSHKHPTTKTTAGQV